jgi:GNAT superfamily N-acetyltransferase
MALATWWRGDALPQPAPLAGLEIGVSDDAALIAELSSLEIDEIVARLAAGHRCYLAWLNGTPTSYGWVATLSASIGELSLAFDLPAGNRYLWDFVTLPEFRGRGIYPRLLRGIIEQEGAAAQHFWIIYAPENAASGAGIQKAGFTLVSDLSFLRDAGVGTVALQPERAALGARLLGVSLYEAVQDGRVISPCWRCVMAGNAACWPHHGSSQSYACTCVSAVTTGR